MRSSLNSLSSSMPSEKVLYPGSYKVYWQHYSIAALNSSIKEPMCHSSKHIASICIQDNQSCHVNFILCLLTVFVLSLFLALLPFIFPSFGNLDENSSNVQNNYSWTQVHCNIKILMFIYNISCFMQYLLLYFIVLCSIEFVQFLTIRPYRQPLIILTVPLVSLQLFGNEKQYEKKQ